MSSDVAIRVENLSKVYRIGAREARYKTLRESVMDVVAAPLRRLRRGPQTEAETLWALRDVSFEIKCGEVVGIIGSNGAGKSTLLKILSRITDPTSGRAEIHGRVGSLLEVGTGFHPELTGRENIYLNGAILGMRRAEIDRKLDEIVAFAGVETFLDTPVKHFSSGMYLRLAFAVAAHLDTELLLVDEVLAVGDAEFQARCLGKMKTVAEAGRTVLLVTHNLQAVTQLCGRAMWVQAGSLVLDSNPSSVVSTYLNTSLAVSHHEVTFEEENAPGNDEVKLLALGFVEDGTVHSTAAGATIRMVVLIHRLPPGLCIGFDLVSTATNVVVLRSFQTDTSSESTTTLKVGVNHLLCRIPGSILNGGHYSLAPRIGVHNRYWIVSGDPLVRALFNLDHSRSPYWNEFGTQGRPGAISPVLDWSVE